MLLQDTIQWTLSLIKMTHKEIEIIIDQKIKTHELRVGWISGIIGIAFLFGNAHAFWLVKQWITQ